MSLKDVPIASQAFPGLPIFLRRQFNWTSLVRLSDPCVSGGSTTTTIVTQAKAFGTNSLLGFVPRPAAHTKLLTYASILPQLVAGLSNTCHNYLHILKNSIASFQCLEN